MTGKKTLGFVVAAAVVGMLASGHQFAADAAKKDSGKNVKCAGANSCKGHGECAAADGSHGCAGKNECKGKGWVKVKTDKECTDKGGTVVKEEKAQ
ncbi:MAG TPA: hypothetical protein VFT43_01130 [Candidatus Polarisedimenticolia bacterium]|nr:hypothetical protein [Candidatus Polarisedimenticolia bacterium]